MPTADGVVVTRRRSHGLTAPTVYDWCPSSGLKPASLSTVFLDKDSYQIQRATRNSTNDSKAALSRLPTLCTNPKNRRYNGSRPDGCYYYRNERHGDRVVKNYYGRRPIAEIAARRVADAFRKRQEAARAIRELRQAS
jgi:hypothetical protein